MNITASEWAREQLVVLDAGWDRLTAVVERLGPSGLERPLTRAWTVKEMLAHLAFWEETSLPVIQTIFRGGPEMPVEQWYGGDDLELASDAPWPDADTHNAREARWARSRSAAAVLERLQRARQKLKSVIATVTDEESRGPIGEQWSGDAVCRHIDHHLAQIEPGGSSVESPEVGIGSESGISGRAGMERILPQIDRGKSAETMPCDFEQIVYRGVGRLIAREK